MHQELTQGVNKKSMALTLRSVLFVTGIGATVPFKPTTDPNMNGKNYLLQATPNGQEALGNWSTEFRDYPGGVEYFEVRRYILTKLVQKYGLIVSNSA